MIKLALVAAEFNHDLIEAMIAAARDEASKLPVEIVREVRVPGCYEVPLVVASLLARGKIEAAVVLGYIERGETQHGEVMGHVVHRALVDMQLATGKPVGIGIIGPGATPEQAESRKDGYARAAVRAVVASRAALAKLVAKKR
ncbi:MAG: 6,7-dimethyl-8-ribityllumazine synthase [Kofleriaceae bacterium]